MTSSSYSFHPSTLSSMSTSCVGDCASAQATFASSSDASRAMPPPVPPSVKDGRRMAGKPMSFTMARASSTECAAPARGHSRPIFSIAALKSERSSAFAIDAGFAPSISTPKRSSTFSSWSFSARLSAVCPPSVGRMASGRSRSMIAASVAPLERLDVRARGELRIGHDRRRVRVDEDDLVPLLAERLGPLGPRVVELARLPDDDGPRADEQYLVQVVASGHATGRRAATLAESRPLGAGT